MSDLPAQASGQVPDNIIQRLVDPRLIDELFNMDPLKLSNADLDVIIAELRKDRQVHLAAASAPKEKKAGAKKLDQLDLSELGL